LTGPVVYGRADGDRRAGKSRGAARNPVRGDSRHNALPGMLAVRDRLLAEARAEIKEAGIETVGYGFLRLHVIDMDGPMDLEAGYFTAGPAHTEHPRLRSGSMAAGSYATMKYQDHARRANQALQDWARDNGLVSTVGPSPRVMNLRVATRPSGPTRRSNRARRSGRSNWRSFWPNRSAAPSYFDFRNRRRFRIR
jgi:hypothetical protein